MPPEFDDSFPGSERHREEGLGAHFLAWEEPEPTPEAESVALGCSRRLSRVYTYRFNAFLIPAHEIGLSATEVDFFVMASICVFD